MCTSTGPSAGQWRHRVDERKASMPQTTMRVLSVADAATMLGVAPRTVWRWLLTGRLTGQHMGTVWMVFCLAEHAASATRPVGSVLPQRVQPTPTMTQQRLRQLGHRLITVGNAGAGTHRARGEVFVAWRRRGRLQLTTCCSRMSSAGSGVTRGPVSPTGPRCDGDGAVSVAGGERGIRGARGGTARAPDIARTAHLHTGAYSRRAPQPRGPYVAATRVPRRCALSSDGRGQRPMPRRDPSHDRRLPARSSAGPSRGAPVHGGVIHPAASTHRQASPLVRADNAVA